MFHCTLALAVCLQAGGSQSSRFLPRDRTLMATSVASPATLWKHRSRIAQLAIWENPRMQSPFLFAANTDKATAAAIDALPQMRKLVELCDRGWTSALVFTDASGRPRPVQYWVGAASEASSLRRVDNLIAKILRSDDRQKLELTRLPIADSPVTSSSYVLSEGDDNWRYRRMLSSVTKARHVALSVGAEYGSDDEQFKKTIGRRVGALGWLVGLGGGDRGGAKLGRRMRLPEGAVPLGRFMLRMRDNLHSETHGPKGRIRDEMLKSGFGEWIGAQSQLYLDAEGTPHVRAEVHYGEDKVAPSFFECFRGNERGLGDEAEGLPDTAFAAMRIAIDSKHTNRWLNESLADGFGLGSDLEVGVGLVRAVAGLPTEGKPDLKDLAEATIAMLPPAAGSLLPELVFVFRSPAREGQVDSILKNLAALIGRGQPMTIKSLGRGEDAVRYLSLKKAIPGGGGMVGGMEQQIMMSLLGGGFVSATRVGDRLYVGFNPRTMRKLVRAVRGGKTLAKRPGFAARFPKGSGRAVEAWFDFPKIAGSMRIIDSALPFFMLGRNVAADAAVAVAVPDGGQEEEEEPKAQQPKKKRAKAKLILPKSSDFAEVLREEFLWSEKQDHGWTLHAEGGTMLSPSAWAGVALAGVTWNELIGLLR